MSHYLLFSSEILLLLVGGTIFRPYKSS